MKINRYTWAVLLCLYIAAVAYLCFAKPDDLPQVSPDFFGIPIDKIAHFLMFLPYPIIAYGTFRPKTDRKAAHLAVLTILYFAGIGLAIGTEHIQGRLEYRSNDIHDFYTDFAGMTLAAVIMAVYIMIKKHHNE